MKATELVFILDKSGSMAGLESDTIGGFNSMLQKQKALPGQCRITTVLFDNRYELLHDRIDGAKMYNHRKKSFSEKEGRGIDPITGPRSGTGGGR